MDQGLAVVGNTAASGRLLQEAAEHATGAGAGLVLLSVFTSEEYTHDLEILDRIADSEHQPSAYKAGDEFARGAGERIARELLADFDVEYTVIGTVLDGKLGPYVVEQADEHDCDHVFLTSKRRSRIGGVLGDAARRVLTEFDGPTTVAREQEPKRRLARLRPKRDDDSHEINWLGEFV